MSQKRPFIVTFIGDMCILRAFIFILSLFPKLTEPVGMYFEPLPTLADNTIRVLIAMMLLIAAYGYLRLKRWGYWLMVSINVYFLVGWIISFQNNQQQSIYQNPISLIIALIFIVPTIRYFNKKIIAS